MSDYPTPEKNDPYPPVQPVSPVPPVQPNDPFPPVQPVAPVETRARRSAFHNAWVPGLVMILIGGFFLLQNLGLVHLNNWWALFILIPAFTTLASAYNAYVNNGGRFTSAVRGPLVGGIIFTILAAAFLLDLDFRFIWPVFLIIGGLAALLGAFGRD